MVHYLPVILISVSVAPYETPDISHQTILLFSMHVDSFHSSVVSTHVNKEL